MNHRKGGPGSAPPLREVTSDEVAQHIGLVRMKLGEMQRGRKLASDLEYDDLFAVGLMAVWEALRRWRPERGAKSTYISTYIWGYVMHYQRKVTRAVGFDRQAGERTTVILSYDFEREGVDVESMLSRLAAPDDTAQAGEAAARISRMVTAAAGQLTGVPRDVALNLLSEDPDSNAAIALRNGVTRERVQKVTTAVRRFLSAVDQGLDVLPRVA